MTRVSLILPTPVVGPTGDIPVIVARFHVKVDPDVPLEGVYENRVLLQIAEGLSTPDMAGIGFTVTVTVKLDPTHKAGVPEVGVTV